MSQPRIFHIATAADVETLRTVGRLEPASLATEGFVHCSTDAQVAATTDRYFAADAELLLIELDPDVVADALQWPEVYPGEHFPHLHGPVDAAAVVGVLPWGPEDRQRVR